MAVQKKRRVDVDDINFKLAQVAEKGQVVVYDTANPGFVKLSASITTTDKAAGVLLFDVVNTDFNAVPVNFQKLETGLSGHVRLLKQGELSTDQTAAGAVFGVGSGVYLAANGKISNAPVSGFADDPAGVRLGTVLAAPASSSFVDVYWDID